MTESKIHTRLRFCHFPTKTGIFVGWVNKQIKTTKCITS